MVAHNGLMRIFWPSDAPNRPTSGVLVGFRNAQSDVFVVSILQEVEVCPGQAMFAARTHSSHYTAPSSRECVRSRHATAPQSVRY